MASRDVRMSLNIPSILLVYWYPHSVFSFTMNPRSASSLVVRPPSSLVVGKKGVTDLGTGAD
eukprot:8771374-Pyramimonas_sp.AAC.2